MDQPDHSRRSLDDPRLLAFLPMVYVAWADGDLEPDEIGAIRASLAGAGGLDEEVQGAVGAWLEPADPPTARELQAVLRRVQEAARGLDRGARRSLFELGQELARASGREAAPAERGALMELQHALGVHGSGAARELLTEERPAPAPALRRRAFDPRHLQAVLDGEQAPVREQLRRLLSGEDFRLPYGLDRESHRRLVLERCRRLAEEGWGARGLPAEVGGEGDVAGFIAAFETLAFGDLSLLVKFGVQFGLFAGSIHQLGTQEHHRRYLPAAGSLELPGCFAMTETGHGSNVAEIETTARYDGESGEWVIDTPSRAAFKDYIGNAASDGRLATVFAQLEIGGERHGVHAFLVPLRGEDGETLPGVSVEDCGEKLGLNGVDNGRLAFRSVRVPRESLLDRFAQVSPEGEYSSPIASPSKRFFTMVGTLVGGRVSVALAASSAAKTALTIAVAYAERRRQFGAPGEPETTLLDYLTHQRRLLPRLASTYAFHFALQDLAKRYAASAEDDRREVETLAAGLKALATWHATDTIQTCREACGGQGYLAVNRFAALKADTDVFTTFEGDNTVLLQLVAKALLTRFRHQFGNLGLAGLLRYAADRATQAISELNPFIVRITAEGHLRSYAFQSAALAFREEHLLASVAQRLKRRIERGAEPFDAMVACQDHLIETARAQVERLVLERFEEAVQSAPREDLRDVLGLLRQLYALGRIEADRGWFLEHGYLEGSKSRAIRKLVNDLCHEIRPHAEPLVDAFGIPDALLGAPIATC